MLIASMAIYVGLDPHKDITWVVQSGREAMQFFIDARRMPSWGSRQADVLLEDFLASKLELLTPTLFDYEIANALRVAVTLQRLSEPDAAAALADFAQYTIVRYDFTGIASLTFDLSGQYQRSAYDSAYLALARS